MLLEFPEMPATVLAERVGWEGSITWFQQNVAKRLSPAPSRIAAVASVISCTVVSRCCPSTTTELVSR